jgi:hypothetical protein
MVICAVCKAESPAAQSRGKLFYATDDWSCLTLFICEKCLEMIPMQRSHHELCGECVGHIPASKLLRAGTLCETQFEMLADAIKSFKEVHAEVLSSAPFACSRDDPDGELPGSASEYIGAWRKQRGLE